ncbi:MAG: hypothetical protein PVJ42_04705 [bacterium]
MRYLTVPVIVFAVVSCVLVREAVAPTVSAEDLPAASQVIERYMEALGGRPAIEGLKTRVCIGRMIYDLDWKRPPYEVVPVAGYATSTGKVLMVEHGADGIRCEGFDGRSTWVQDAGGIQVREEPIRSKIAWLLDPRGALRLEAYFPGLHVTARENIDGRALYVVEPDELDRAYYALYFDVETGLLVRIGYYWEIEDYREVDGVLVPFRVDMSRKGGSTTLVLDLVRHNLPLEPGLFALPGGVNTPAE